MFYLTLSSAIKDAELDHGISQLDPISKEILKRVASADQLNTALKVKDLYDIASVPTIHARLYSLIEQGWLEKYKHETDKRVALLTIAPRARQTINSMSEGLQKWYKTVATSLPSLLIYILAWPLLF